jgi:predicted glycosyltransferase
MCAASTISPALREGSQRRSTPSLGQRERGERDPPATGLELGAGAKQPPRSALFRFMTASVLLYVQHLLGVGHLERALRLSSALSRSGMRVTLVSGGERVPPLARAAAERVVELAPVKASDVTFRALVDSHGQPIGEALRAERREALLAAFKEARPDALVFETFPFGRRAFRFELDPLLAAARRQAPRPLLLSSIRDILVAPSTPQKSRELVRRVRDEFDAVLVHGDPAFVTLERSFPAAREIADRLIYTGYVGPDEMPSRSGEGRGEVIVSAGGGAAGGTLLRTALAARREGCLKALPWRLIAGPNLPQEEYADLAKGLEEDAVLERYREDFAQLLFACRLSISQAGYNTMLDILAAGAPAVVVPFSAGRENEQALRAELFAARGIVESVAEPDLTPERLAAAIARALEHKRKRVAIATNGAEESAKILARMLRLRSRQLVSATSEAIIRQ